MREVAGAEPASPTNFLMKKKLFFLAIFAIAFAFVEASVAFYLRQLTEFESIHVMSNFKVLLDLKAITFILPGSPVLNSTEIGRVEIFREAATIIMLAGVALIVGKNRKQRWGAFLIAFSLWDLFYYVFLRVITNWPTSLFDIDIFFLIPVPWVGPVITPIILSTFLFIWGLRLYLKKT